MWSKSLVPDSVQPKFLLVSFLYSASKLIRWKALASQEKSRRAYTIQPHLFYLALCLPCTEMQIWLGSAFAWLQHLRGWRGGHTGEDGEIPDQTKEGKEITYSWWNSRETVWNMLTIIFFVIVRFIENGLHCVECTPLPYVQISFKIITHQQWLHYKQQQHRARIEISLKIKKHKRGPIRPRFLNKISSIFQAITLTEKTMKGWNRGNNTLPEDLHYSGHQLVTLKVNIYRLWRTNFDNIRNKSRFGVKTDRSVYLLVYLSFDSRVLQVGV